MDQWTIQGNGSGQFVDQTDSAVYCATQEECWCSTPTVLVGRVQATTGPGLMALNCLFGAGVDVHESTNYLECSWGASQYALIVEGLKGASQHEINSTVGGGELSPDKGLNHPVGVDVQLGLEEATVDWNLVRGIHLPMGMSYQMHQHML